MPKEFWEIQLEGNLADYFKNFISAEWLNQEPPAGSFSDDDYPILLPSVQMTTVATSQMFYDEPWFNIDYEYREAETARLYHEYCRAIAAQLGDEGVDMDKLYKLNRETMYDDFPDAWDSPVAYELGERVHLWVEANWTWFLGVLQEDKELPIEISFGRFTSKDMRTLTDHMTSFSAG